MATYLVDYENVHYNGLAGIENLTEQDCLVIFIGRKNKTLPVDTVIKLSRTHAYVIWKKSEKTAPNYLDIQLASYLGFLIGEGKGTEFHIISKDQGFVAAIDFWTPRKPNMKFALQETISGKKIADTESNRPESKKIEQKKLSSNKQNPEPKKQKPVSNDGKIKPSIKKKASKILTSYNLVGGNYTRVYSILKKSKNEKQFLSAIKTAYIGDKYQQLGNELLPVFKEYHSEK